MMGLEPAASFVRQPSRALDRTTWEQLGSLGARRHRGRQGELKRCTPTWGTCGPQAAAMRLDDRAADGQSHTSPVMLSRKKSTEYLVCLLPWQSHSGIADGDQQLTVASFRVDDKLTSAARFLHSIDAVEHEVHKHLLQLHSVCHDLGKILGKLGAD